MMDQWVTLQQQSAAAIVTLSRPERANALSEAMLDQLCDVDRQLNGYKGINAVILTGQGDKCFCAGADLKERITFAPSDVQRVLQKYRTGLSWIAKCPVPVIAALNGSALGGGLELALMCDLRVCAPHAQFALPETSLGIIPGAGGTQRLPRLIGAARANELILLASRIDAQQALAWGLVNRVTAASVSVLDDTLQWLAPVLNGSPTAVRAAIRALRNAGETGIDQGLQVELEAYEMCLQSADRIEALRAFQEKRPAQFNHR